MKFSGLREFFKISRISLDPFLFSVLFSFFFPSKKGLLPFFFLEEEKKDRKMDLF